jgi:hypothetical protein
MAPLQALNFIFAENNVIDHQQQITKLNGGITLWIQSLFPQASTWRIFTELVHFVSSLQWYSTLGYSMYGSFPLQQN